MKKRFLIMVFIFLSQMVFAKENNTLQLKINFKYQRHNEVSNFHTMIPSDPKNNQWKVIGGFESKNNRLMLLAQSEHSDSKRVKVHFLLLENNRIVSQPQIVVAYNTQGNIILTGKDEKIHLEVVANC